MGVHTSHNAKHRPSRVPGDDVHGDVNHESAGHFCHWEGPIALGACGDGDVADVETISQ